MPCCVQGTELVPKPEVASRIRVVCADKDASFAVGSDTDRVWSQMAPGVRVELRDKYLTADEDSATSDYWLAAVVQRKEGDAVRLKLKEDPMPVIGDQQSTQLCLHLNHFNTNVPRLGYCDIHGDPPTPVCLRAAPLVVVGELFMAALLPTGPNWYCGVPSMRTAVALPPAIVQRS